MPLRPLKLSSRTLRTRSRYDQHLFPIPLLVLSGMPMSALIYLTALGASAASAPVGGIRLTLLFLVEAIVTECLKSTWTMPFFDDETMEETCWPRSS